MSASPSQIFRAFLHQGLTAFGGPVAHLGYFRAEFVDRRRWLDERSYADLVALCQFLPGPASSQVGLAIGLQQAGYRGALAAWAGFTLPSALLLIVFALMLDRMNLPAGLLHGLKLAALAVVSQAVWSMGRSLCPDTFSRLLALGAAGLLTAWPGTGSQLLVLAGAGLFGWLWLNQTVTESAPPFTSPLTRRQGLLWLALFGALLLALPLLAAESGSPLLAQVDTFYRAGALVFGGGHVVLPLLQAEVVHEGGLSIDRFMAGYGATQAVPGPLFTFAAFLGAAGPVAPNGWLGGMLALLAIFLPAFLLVAGALPFWDSLRRHAPTRAALAGVNAAVVGILLAALYDPIGRDALHGPLDLLVAGAALFALTRGRQAPWRVVAGCALAGWLLA